MNFQDQLAADRNTAFELLADIVAANHANGRLSYGAALKPSLQRRTHNGFSEVRLGYGSFREFLSAAERTGFIRLHDAPRGPDLVATPPGVAPPIAPPTPSGRPPRIRKDLWDSFIDWSEGLLRVYDREDLRARKVPENPVPLEPETDSYLRVEILADKEHKRFVPIPPMSIEENLVWMRDFAESEPDHETRARLLKAISDPRPVAAFTSALYSFPGGRARWAKRRYAHVEERIRKWADETGLPIAIHEVEDHGRDPDEATRATEPQGVPGASSGDDRLTRLREAVNAAVERMSEAELHELRLPVGYLIR